MTETEFAALAASLSGAVDADMIRFTAGRVQLPGGRTVVVRQGHGSGPVARITDADGESACLRPQDHPEVLELFRAVTEQREREFIPDGYTPLIDDNLASFLRQIRDLTSHDIVEWQEGFWSHTLDISGMDLPLEGLTKLRVSDVHVQGCCASFYDGDGRSITLNSKDHDVVAAVAKAVSNQAERRADTATALIA